MNCNRGATQFSASISSCHDHFWVQWGFFRLWLDLQRTRLSEVAAKLGKHLTKRKSNFSNKRIYLQQVAKAFFSSFLLNEEGEGNEKEWWLRHETLLDSKETNEIYRCTSFKAEKLIKHLAKTNTRGLLPIITFNFSWLRLIGKHFK